MQIGLFLSAHATRAMVFQLMEPRVCNAELALRPMHQSQAVLPVALVTLLAVVQHSVTVACRDKNRAQTRTTVCFAQRRWQARRECLAHSAMLGLLQILIKQAAIRVLKGRTATLAGDRVLIARRALSSQTGDNKLVYSALLVSTLLGDRRRAKLAMLGSK